MARCLSVCVRLPGATCALEMGGRRARVTPRAHDLRQRTDLIDFAWGTLEMHCGSIRQIGSEAGVKS